MSVQDQKTISKYFGNRPTLHIVGLSIVLKSPHVGLFLSQLLYWHGKGKRKPWIYKNANDFYMETGLTREMQETAIKKLKYLGVLETKLAGVPATRHFKVNMQKLREILPSLKENANLHYLNPPIKYVYTDQPIPESTNQTTSDIVDINRDNYWEQKEKLTKMKGF